MLLVMIICVILMEVVVVLLVLLTMCAVVVVAVVILLVVQDQAHQFRNLKTALKRHPETGCHKTYVSEQERSEEENRKYLARTWATSSTF